MAVVRALVTDWEFDDLEIERSGLAAAGVELVDAQCRTPEEVVAAVQESGARALLVQYAPIDAQVLRSVDVGIVARYGVGVDNVDLEVAAQVGAIVCNAVGYGDEEVATHAASLALAALRSVPFHDRDVRAGGWDYKRGRPMPRVSERTLGVLGLGRIGQELVRLLGQFFGRVVAADPFLPEDRWPEAVESCTVAEVLAAADVVSLHLPLSDQTRHLIDDDALATMQPGSILVNTARGGLVDEDAVVRALDRGHLSAAALDVLETEPAPADHPLRTHPRAIVTPHTAWYSDESERVLRRMAVANVAAWATGGDLRDVVVGP